MLLGEILQTFERMFNGSAGLVVSYIFVKIEVGKRCDNHNVCLKSCQELGNTLDQFCELEACERSGDSNQTVESGRLLPPFSRKARYEKRVDLVRAVEVQNPLPMREDSRKEVVR